MTHTFRIGHLFAGIGGSALGAQAAVARFGGHEARFETVGGSDFDALACKDFERLVGAPALCADAHDLQPADLRRAWGNVAPDVVMSSPPCKSFSGLLSAKRAAEPQYVRMSQLLLTSLHLLCSTWDQPPAVIFFENVPRIASRGKKLVADCVALLESAGYAVTTGNHDCGELGHLAQHRRRWFLLARHRSRVPQFVYQPPKQRVRACGEVLGPLPMPGDTARGGAMHSVPKLSWRNWVRLSLIPPGGDWRDLPGTLLAGEKRREKFRRDPVTPWSEPTATVTGPGGSAAEHVADPRPTEWFPNVYRVGEWTEPSGTVTGSGKPSSGQFAVADPRWGGGRLGVNEWDEPGATVTGEALPNNGRYSVADPRFGHADRVTDWDAPVGTITASPAPSSGAAAVADPRVERFANNMPVAGWEEPIGTVIGAMRPGGGAQSIADPRFADGKKRNWQQVAGVTPWTEPAPTVTSGAKIHAGAFQVADPRLNCKPRPGAYRVLRWEDAAATITGSQRVDNGEGAVADPRPSEPSPLAWLQELDPDRAPGFIPVIVAADGTWHRPLTTYELAMLQSFPSHVDGQPLVLSGTSHTRWRQAIGNAVPPDAAQAIAEQLLMALLVTAVDGWVLSSNDIWVAPHLGLEA